jgi:tetratricopeptide (TPR) repeat protein
MRLRPFIGWAIFFFIIAIIAQAVPSVSGSYYFIKGKRLYSKGNYEEAAAAYEHSVGSDPDFARGYIELGLAYFHLKKLAQSEEAFTKAAKIHEDSCALCGLGMVYNEQKRNKEAEVALKKALDLNPSDNCAINYLGRVYYKQEKYKEAIEIFRKELEIRPNAFSYHYLGNSYGYIEQFQEARQAYKEALRLDPEYTDVYVDLAYACYRTDRLAEAAEIYRKAIREDPENVAAHIGLGLSELKQGNKEIALAHYLIAQRLDPEAAKVLDRQLSRR